MAARGCVGIGGSRILWLIERGSNALIRLRRRATDRGRIPAHAIAQARRLLAPALKPRPQMLEAFLELLTRTGGAPPRAGAIAPARH